MVFCVASINFDSLDRFAADKREALLEHGRLAVGVHQDQLVERAHSERERGLLVDALIRKVLEDLLE